MNTTQLLIIFFITSILQKFEQAESSAAFCTKSSHHYPHYPLITRQHRRNTAPASIFLSTTEKDDCQSAAVAKEGNCVPLETPTCPDRRRLLSSVALGATTASTLPVTSSQSQLSPASSCRCCCRLYNSAMLLPPAANALVEMTPPSPDLVKTYDRPRNAGVDNFFSYSMSVGMEDYESKARPYKTRLFQKLFRSLAGNARGDYLPVVLEVGMGTFPNAPYYSEALQYNSELKGLDILSVDPNDSMFDYAKDSAKTSGLLSLSTDISLRNVHGVAEALPFPDGSVDAIIGTLTLCSVTSQERALSEIRRVLKPQTGQFLFWEHVLSEDDAGLALRQRVLSPIQTIVADGCHLNRRTGATIQNAGFAGGVEMEYLNLDVSDIIGPTVFGIATA